MRNNDESSKDAVKSAPWWDTDKLRSKKMATRTRVRKPIIGVQVITITCPCGGVCESAGGSTSWASTMIHIGDIHDGVISVTCPDCGEIYTVPAGVFEKKLHSK